MKSKKLNLGIFSILSLIMLIAFASATLTLGNVDSDDLPLTEGTHSFSIDVSSNETETVTITANDFTNVDFFTSTVSMDDNTKSVIITYNVSDDINFDFGEDITTILTADGSISTNISKTLTFDTNDFCEGCSNKGELKIKDISVDTKKGFGDDEDYWYPFDEIEVTVEVENNGNWDIDDIEVNWALYIGGKEYDSDDIDEISLDDDEDEELTFTIELDDDVVDEDYLGKETILYVWAKGTIDDSDADEYDDTDTCASDSIEIEDGVKDDNFIILENINVPSAQCGGSLFVTANLWNIGDDDEEDVYVIIRDDSNLGIEEQINIGDIDNYDSEKLSTTLKIPSDAEKGSYNLIFSVYDEDNDLFENDDDDKAEFEAELVISGNCGSSASGDKVSISANKVSGGNSGEELVVKAIVTNAGSSSATYNLLVDGYSSWASSANIAQPSLIIGSGESKEVLITLNVEDTASGANSFNFKVYSGSTLVATQPVTVSITEKSLGEGLSSLENLFGNNTYLWGIIILNVLLILIIIIVIIRIARR